MGELKLIVRRSTWARFIRSILRNTEGKAAAIGALATSFSTVIALGVLFVVMVKK